MKEVEFFGDGERDWALFYVNRIAYQNRREVISAIKMGDKIAFGRVGDWYFDSRHPENVTELTRERAIPIAVLRRVVGGQRPRVPSANFEAGERSSTVIYRTSCGERREVKINVLRAIIEDAEALPAQP